MTNMTNEIGHSTHLFYYVGLRRKDGNPPTLEKASDERMFLIYEDAEKYLNEMDDSVREYFSVFVAIACIPHIPAVTKEVTGQPWYFSAEFAKL